MANKFDYIIGSGKVKTSTFVHITSTEIWRDQDGKKFNPTEEQKLIHAIYGMFERETITNITPVFTIIFRTQSQMNTHFYKACEDAGLDPREVDLKSRHVCYQPA